MVQLLIWIALVTRLFSLKENGNNFIGKAKILSTPMGKIMSLLINEGVKLGVSSRGIGSLKQTREGVNIVGDDFMLSTAPPTSFPILLHLMLSLKESWKVKIGFGMVVSSVRSFGKNLQTDQHTCNSKTT